MKHMVKGFVCLAFAAGMSFAASAATTTVNNWSELLAAVSTASDGDVIVLAAGDYTVVDSGVTLSHGVTVRGATGDPKDVTITDSVSGKRAFTLEHPDARIEALTITGSGLGGGGGAQHGGHLNLSAGTVSNCVIKGGLVSSGNNVEGYGGNIYMTGGVVEDSTLRRVGLVARGAAETFMLRAESFVVARFGRARRIQARTTRIATVPLRPASTLRQG